MLNSVLLCFSQAFEEYGEIEEGVVIMDKASGKSRGFGFVTFKHMDSAQRALKDPSKTIDVRISFVYLVMIGLVILNALYLCTLISY